MATSIARLRSPYDRLGRLVYFGRMLDKIRLHAAGQLPPDYSANVGVDPSRPNLFDARCVRFIGVDYAALRERTLAGGTDEEILTWATANGKSRTDEECEAWNRFMSKVGWRDDRSAVLRQRTREYGFEDRSVECFFDLLDLDEGRRGRAWQPSPPVIVLMGAAGSGKTTLGLRLAGALGWSFRDADEFHPDSNIDKMASGAALDDADRAPWLAAIRAHIDATLASNEGGVVTCSALKERYRSAICAGPRVKLVYLEADLELLRERLRRRQGHFMKEAMLLSQLSDLEVPVNALKLDAAQPPQVNINRIREALDL